MIAGCGQLTSAVGDITANTVKTWRAAVYRSTDACINHQLSDMQQSSCR